MQSGDFAANCHYPSPGMNSVMLALLQVIRRTSPQVSQLRNGLAETGIWPLLVQRKDLIPILFPRESEAELSPQVQRLGKKLKGRENA